MPHRRLRLAPAFGGIEVGLRGCVCSPCGSGAARWPRRERTSTSSALCASVRQARASRCAKLRRLGTEGRRLVGAPRAGPRRRDSPPAPAIRRPPQLAQTALPLPDRGTRRSNAQSSHCNCRSRTGPTSAMLILVVPATSFLTYAAIWKSPRRSIGVRPRRAIEKRSRL
jgi:hypothetical protein